MRISQLQNLVWAGNVLLFAGMAFVVYRFWEQREAAAATTAVAEWPETGQTDRVGEGWPGPVADFQHIWTVPVNGEVPPPPTQGPTDPPPPDLEQQLRQDVGFLGGWDFLGSPDRSIAVVRYKGQPRSIRAGDRLDQWQLVEFQRDAAQGTGRLTFRHATGKEVTLEQTPPKGGFPPANGPPLIQRRREGAFHDVTADRLPRQAWLGRDGEWRVPEEEVDWWERFGEEQVLAKASLQPAPDGKGVVLKSWPRVPPLEDTRGLSQGDVVRSINGHPVASKEDILSYLRGEGRGKSQYRVVVERDGRERTVIYNLVASGAD